MTDKPSLMEWGDILIRAAIRTVLICLSLYGLYVLKSSIGINLSEHYHAIDVFQSPVKVVTDILHV